MSVSVAVQVRAAHDAFLAVHEPDLVAAVVTGRDRISWLNGLLTCDLMPAKPGDAVYGLAVAQKGRILSDLFVLVEAERALLLLRRAAAPGLVSDLERHLMMEDAELAPAFDTFSALSVHGPKASLVLGAAREAGASGGVVDLTGLGGAVLAWPLESDEGVRRALGALESQGGAIADEPGAEALRLERGVPRFGVDFDATTYPQEAGLERTAVSFSKGCYLGQEVVCMLQMRGHVKRKLAQLIVDGAEPPKPGTHVLDAEGGADVGSITSSAASPTLGKPVALAMLKYSAVVPGASVSVDGHGARVEDLDHIFRSSL